MSERTGFKNWFLDDISGRLIVQLTNHPFEAASIVKVDEAAGVLHHTARDGANDMMTELHRVGLDGKKNVRLTDPAYSHSVTLSRRMEHFVHELALIPTTSRRSRA